MTGRWLDEVWGDAAQPGDVGDGVEHVAELSGKSIVPRCRISVLTLQSMRSTQSRSSQRSKLQLRLLP